jgi:heat shock protein HslJ
MKKVLLIMLSVLFLFTVSSAKTTKFKKIKTLSSTSWKLTDFQNETLVFQYIGSKTLGEITLNFSKKENLISGFSGVNTYSGNFEINGENITFSNLASTKLYGPRNVMDQEYKYLTVLPEVATYKVLDEKTLKLTTSDGLELTFTRTK